VAILWSQEKDGNRYEVRTAGNSVRLYRNGIFHSQYNPQQPISGQVWDLLFLPALFLPLENIKRVLVLGVGGGAVIKQLETFFSPKHITGVELDATHIKIAKRFFGVRGKGVELIQADAKDWVENYNGVGFDLIIDDIFMDQDGEPVRAIEASSDWHSALHKLLSSCGVLVMNYPSLKELKKCAYFKDQKIKKYYSASFSFSAPYNENKVAAHFRIPVEAADFNANLANHALLGKAQYQAKMRYKLRKM